MSKNKEKGLNYYRQSKGFGYKQPQSHNDYEFVTHRFTEKRLLLYIKECMERVNGGVDEIDYTIIEDFVKNNN